MKTCYVNRKGREVGGPVDVVVEDLDGLARAVGA